MSDAPAKDLKTEIVALAKELDTLAKEADEGGRPKIAKAAADLKANFLKGMKLDFKPETLSFYQDKAALLHKLDEGERKTAEVALGKEITRLTGEIEACEGEAKKAGAAKSLKWAGEIKAKFLKDIKAYKSQSVVEKYDAELKEVEAALKKEMKEEVADAGPAFTIDTSKFKESKLLDGSETKKYEEWLKLAEAKGGVKAAKELFGGQATKMSDGRFHFKLSKGSRVYIEDSGKTVKVSGPDHEKEKK